MTRRGQQPPPEVGAESEQGLANKVDLAVFKIGMLGAMQKLKAALVMWNVETIITVAALVFAVIKLSH